METSDEKLILNGQMFFSVRSLLHQKKPSADIIAIIDDVLKQGADINARDANDNNNTILHIATQKEEKDIVSYLLEKGAQLLHNKHRQTPLELVQKINTPIGKEIANILAKHDKHVASCSTNPKQKVIEPSFQQTNSTIKVPRGEHISYKKRGGTSGVSGQLYETKLLSLVLYRALHDLQIEEFYLAANINGIGDFDDVCFRYENEACFIQAKHVENTGKKLTIDKLRSEDHNLGLGKYFDSFLRIKQSFSQTSEDPMFKGNFENLNCSFVLYTPLKAEFESHQIRRKQTSSKILDIISTGPQSTDIFQIEYEKRDKNISYLTKYIKREHMKELGKILVHFISSPVNAGTTNDLIKIYHPALAKKVINISKVQEPLKVRKKQKSGNTSTNATNDSQAPTFIKKGNFRPEFFDSTDEMLITLKQACFNEIVYTLSPKTALTKEEIIQKIETMAKKPCAQSVSELIGSPLTFDDKNGIIRLNTDKIRKNDYKEEEIQKINYTLQKMQVSGTMIAQAVNIAGQKKLESLDFELPKYFGNLDIENKKKERLDLLVNIIKKLISYYAESNRFKHPKIIVINDNIMSQKILTHKQLINSNGSLSSAVGNLLLFDSETGYYKFNTQGDLEENAHYMLVALKESINDLSDYRLHVAISGFPIDCFKISEYDNNEAAEFLSKLWLYTNQAQEEDVESIIKKEINLQYNADKYRDELLFHVHSDAIFLRFHDDIVKWWKKQNDVQYLTKNTTIFETAKKDIVGNPLLTVLNVMYVRKINNLGIQFNDNAIQILNIDNHKDKNENIIFNVVSDAVVLSAAKIMQLNDYDSKITFMNLDYVNNAPRNVCGTMIEEIKIMKEGTLVIISETPLDQVLTNTLIEILHAFRNKNVDSNRKIIIITSEPLTVLKNYNQETIKDNSIDFEDLTSESQEILLDKFTIIYQGQELALNKIIDEDSKKFINGKLLWSLLNKEKLQVGHTLVTQKYNEIKDYFINRDLKRKKKEFKVNTLDDLKENIVLISSKPCMGKTTLLTHLALATKKVDYKPWIVYIDLYAHVRKLKNLNSKNVEELMDFLCKCALKDSSNIDKSIFMKIGDETIDITDRKSGNISFELKLFIHSYNSGNIIFLFDGFDRIRALNKNEGMELFTALQRANKRMWITCDCYEVAILKNKFGTPYELEKLSTLQQKSFLERFFATNLKLEKLNHEQCNNILLFFDYIGRCFNPKSDFRISESMRSAATMLSVPCHLIYLTVLEHFKNDCNNLSIRYLRETIQKKCRLNSFTVLDRFLGTTNIDETLPLAGTPLHLYIAANYFVFQITDKFDLHIDTKMFCDRANVCMNAITLYEKFLKVNLKNICEVQNKASVDKEQEKIRDNFFETHKKLALYAICKESDVSKFLTESEIVEVKKTIKMIESGEIKTPFIDCVVDKIPKFYNGLFAEYFAVDYLSQLLKKINNLVDDVNHESIWNFVVNVILVASPKGLRDAFDYKLKYDPELAEIASNENCKRVVFNLLLKQNQAKDATNFDQENALSVAINEGLVNITNFLLKSIQNNVDKSNLDKLTTMVKCGAGILSVVSPSLISKDVLSFIQNVDAESLVQKYRSIPEIEDVQDVVASRVCMTLKQLSKDFVDASGNNENLALLMEQLPYYLLNSKTNTNQKK
ncbi:uncharacterized protein LOC142980665 [Anticarsia gemmatalis]|uniref:uncharacterized protein LOC142980665 n=1 Tax=Anticarsia gemmatalis TaxID=129554 RepID=UPI003F769AF3